MKILISYFYNLRFLKQYQIPVSTAIWDPKWFHEGKGDNWVFEDKNGVINGLRIEELNPGNCHACGCPCKFHKTEEGSKTCYFLKKYREGLEKQNFEEVIKRLNNMASVWKKMKGFEEEPEIILMVYETPDNPCSERQPLMDWFKENGYELKEWENQPPS